MESWSVKHDQKAGKQVRVESRRKQTPAKLLLTLTEEEGLEPKNV